MRPTEWAGSRAADQPRITAKSTDAELLAACPDHPVYRITIES